MEADIFNIMAIENEILELVDNQGEYTRGDLQGRAQAIAHNAYKQGMSAAVQNMSVDEWLEIGNNKNFN